MKKIIKFLVILISITIILLITTGVLVPSLISTDKLPATLIVILTGGLVALVAVISLLALNSLRKS